MSEPAPTNSALDALVFDRALIAEIRVELGATMEAHDRLERALQTAQHAFDQSLLRRQQLEARLSSIQDDIRRRQQLYCPISLLPDDIISEIFIELLTQHARDGTVRMNEARSRLPGILGAVSRRWRRVAMSIARLWSYINLQLDGGYDPRKASAMLSHMQLFLQRSRSAQLDFEINLYEGEDLPCEATRAASHHAHLLRTIFGTLSSHIVRLRSFEVTGKADYSADNASSSVCCRYLCELAIGLLRLPTPRLEVVQMEFSDNLTHPDGFWAPYPDLPLPMYLPDAPRLLKLYLMNVPLMCCGGTHPGLPSLEHLDIRTDKEMLYKAHIWGMLSLCPSLTYLRIECPETVFSEPSPQLPAPSSPAGSLFITLEAGSSVLDGGIQFPRLTSLTILGCCRDGDRFFRSIASTLTSLDLMYGSYEAQDFDVYAILRNLEKVLFDGAASFDRPAFVAAMDAPGVVMWPRLRNVNFGPFDDEGTGPALGNWMLEFVQKRNDRAARDRDVQPLERISLTALGASLWVVAKLRDILGVENVCVYN